jgi:hypothetical protein
MSTREHIALSAEEQQRRREVLQRALAQVRLEGLEPDPAFFEYAERYCHGEITLDDAISDFVQKISRLTSTR